MLRIGLTGGIGSGKSAAAERFRELGITVIDADEIARELVKPGQPALEEIVLAFGADMRKANGKLDREALRRRVFGDANERHKLEAILHPRIREEMQQRVRSLPRDTPYCVLMIPLLAEGGGGSYDLDRILVVDAPEDKRIRWVVSRSQLDPEEVRRIIATQATPEVRRRLADDWIENDDGLEELRAQVDALHERYVALAGQRD